MILQMWAVFDHKVEAFMQPQFFRSKGEALRSFSDAVQQDGTVFTKHPEDYSFWFRGTFDDSNGSVTPASDADAAVFKALDFVPPLA